MKKLGNNFYLIDEDQRVVMMFGTYTDMWSMKFPMRDIMHMDLALHQIEYGSRVFRVVKNRWGYMDQISQLRTIFDEYTVLDNNWHGMIQISDSDYLRLALSIG